MILETLDRQYLDARPAPIITRQLVDVPVCTEQETAAIVADFRHRAEAIAAYCETIGTLPVFIIPASNDGDYEPSRSVLPAITPRAERVAFTREFERARGLEKTEPLQALSVYRALVEQYPTFAETHYRLARLLEHSGAWDEARERYVKAREHDAMPMRVPRSCARSTETSPRSTQRSCSSISAVVLGELSPHGTS